MAKFYEYRCNLGLYTTLRKLWAQHVFWTRDYIIAAIANAPDKQAATERLLQNQVDIGNAIAAFYGKEAGDKLAALLKEHILIAATLIEAAKAGNNNEVKAQDAKWHQNADEIAKFLSKANPYWTEKDMQDMLYLHLKLTTEEVLARLAKDWKKDIESFDNIYDQAIHMADMFTMGLIKQFPSKA